jgi:hypothetical protein
MGLSLTLGFSNVEFIKVVRHFTDLRLKRPSDPVDNDFNKLAFVLSENFYVNLSSLGSLVSLVFEKFF